ncbi:hypothetical protein DTL42_19025 [Bremerella cremea]|uniref:Uncharacterized protein n=1 Tax=Bremerella cremea TaxID=1031537 RepID=A0A368KMD2_9BACT|nr:hypothetical protein [Bremerella cremea]RCS43250.1 hypothetical protein DTL42_19025 [Bremerella cremea]
MSRSSSLLRFAPLILPLVALVGAVLGLAIRANSFPSRDNVLLVAFAAMISGIVPVCLVIGCAFLVIDLSWAALRRVVLVFFAVTAVAVFVVAYFYGGGLDF